MFVDISVLHYKQRLIILQTTSNTRIIDDTEEYGKNNIFSSYYTQVIRCIKSEKEYI